MTLVEPGSILDFMSKHDVIPPEELSTSECRREYSLRELCDEFHVTPRALRFYESQGLLAPKRNGVHRIYSTKDRTRLKLVLRGKRFGFSLAELREHLDLYDLQDGERMQLERAVVTAREKLKEMEDKRRDLTDAIDELTNHIQKMDGILATHRKGSL
ncbi:MAG: MerR family DNA-binding transcriptional regulator [Neomegalonema sp.]|nr:MerR family DNA-binding transcriptional regulator [Neomegalonema sp.]